MEHVAVDTATQLEILTAVQDALNIEIYHRDGSINFDVPVDAQSLLELFMFGGGGATITGTIAHSVAWAFWPATVLVFGGMALGGEFRLQCASRRLQHVT